MFSHYPPRFEREMGCTVEDMQRWLPGALPGLALQHRPDGVDAAVGEGRVSLRWQVLPPRRLGLASFPRLQVLFDFPGVEEARRQGLMKHFDLYTQRGGG